MNLDFNKKVYLVDTICFKSFKIYFKARIRPVYRFYCLVFVGSILFMNDKPLKKHI